jgi:hypothetical protein
MQQPWSPEYSKLFHAVTLEGTLSTLAQSKKVQERLSDEWGPEQLESVLAMMREAISEFGSESEFSTEFAMQNAAELNAWANVAIVAAVLGGTLAVILLLFKH